MDADVVVIGAGHNGLVCAAYLARAGLDIVVLEARDTVGGCASTVDALGARVNICNCEHLTVRSLPLLDELDLARHGLDYLDVDPAQMSVSWDDPQPWFAFSDVGRTLDGLARTHPGEVEGYRRYVADAAPIARLVLEAGSAPPSALGLAGVAARSRGAGVARMLEWSRRSAAEVLDRYFSPSFSGPMLGGGPVVWGVSPMWPGTGVGAVAPVMKHLVPCGRPVGGSGALTDALAASAAASGARICTSTLVSAIGCEGGRVSTVSTSTGDVWRAAQVVVACDPRRAMVEWLSDPPASAAGMIDRWALTAPEPGYESKIDAVLDAEPRSTLVTEELAQALGVDPLDPTTMIAPSAAGSDWAHSASTRGEVAERPVLMANVPTHLDPSMAPPGRHVFSLEVLYTPYDLAGGWEGSSEPQRWLELYAETVEPGFLESIVDWRVMTPRRYETEFHMPRGHATSFAGGPVAALVGRTERERSRYVTPVDGLFLTGAATFPGAGVWGAAGRNAAHVVLAHAGRPARAARIRVGLPPS